MLEIDGKNYELYSTNYPLKCELCELYKKCFSGTLHNEDFLCKSKKNSFYRQVYEQKQAEFIERIQKLKNNKRIGKEFTLKGDSKNYTVYYSIGIRIIACEGKLYHVARTKNEDMACEMCDLNRLCYSKLESREIRGCEDFLRPDEFLKDVTKTKDY